MPDTQSIPLFDLNPEIENLWEDLNEAIQEVLRSGQFILGPEVEEFEDEVAGYLGVDHAVGVNSGTDALVIGLRALGVEPGDEVITTPFTFFATAEAISNIGAEPVFVDIDPETFNLDPNEVEKAITPETAGILPVHLYGAPAAMTQIMAIAEANDLVVLEDCAQSFGARYEGDCPGCRGEDCEEEHRTSLSGRVTGSIGHAGAFSFFPTKNLGAYGDGGLIATDDSEVAETAQMLRKHGGRNKYHNEVLGYNSRLDALQAAILKVKLPYVDEYNRSRRTIARRYNDLLDECEGVEVPPVLDGHVFHQYTVRVKNGHRTELKEELSEQEIGHNVYYPVPCHQLPVYEERADHLPEAEQAAEEVLSLPMWPQADADVQENVAQIVKRVFT
ncbi:DegT/DnrJ/EryC1/StrS family aminotransferase [Salinibacter ruber]|uniref:DegT/DnrJ/EryC1/StrS family aminotransferase n=1 Tax=Salinibacter ruber TaxID=146919 RepID=UPI000DDAC402|nr:DegT/DnrJ/EryC1/StrS family aminotransferase [Salinibacter ruber]